MLTRSQIPREGGHGLPSPWKSIRRRGGTSLRGRLGRHLRPAGRGRRRPHHWFLTCCGRSSRVDRSHPCGWRTPWRHGHTSHRQVPLCWCVRESELAVTVAGRYAADRIDARRARARFEPMGTEGVKSGSPYVVPPGKKWPFRFTIRIPIFRRLEPWGSGTVGDFHDNHR